MRLVTLDANEADDVLAGPGQALRGTVRHVAELIDRRADAGAGALPHPVLPVQHARDGRYRDPRVFRDVIERYHVVTYRLCKRLHWRI